MATQSPPLRERLSHRSLVELEGDGVLAFVNKILSCDVKSLNESKISYGALLSPQGKILHDLFIHEARESSLMLECCASQSEALIARLKLYRLRARFAITLRRDLAIVVGGEGPADPRCSRLGARSMVASDQAKAGTSYDMRRYALGIADSAEIGSGKLFPHEANFDQLGGVDFKKGCYIGQEVVSRMQHRATARSRILPLLFTDNHDADEIRSGDILLGEILGRSGNQALALMRLDRLAEVNAPLPFRITRPEWARFDMRLP